MGKYIKLFETPVNYELFGCDAELLHGNLLKESESGAIIAQLQFRNISDLNMQSLYIGIKCYNEMGEPLYNGAPYIFSYQDLNAKYGEKFGDRVPILLPDKHTRKIEVSIEKYMLSDGTIHTRDEFQTVEIPAVGKPIPKVLLDDFEETASDEYRTIFPKTTYPCITENGGWICSCGKYNRTVRCVRCRLYKRQLDIITPEKLEENHKACVEEREKALKAQKKKRRRFRIIIEVLILILLTFVMFVQWLIPDVIAPAIKYEQATSLKEAGEFESAYDIFTELGDYKDSKEKADEAYDHFKTGTFTETKTITVGMCLTFSEDYPLYYPARGKTENVEAEVTMEYTDGVPDDCATIIFTGHTFNSSSWSVCKFIYIGSFKNGSITGNGQLHKLNSGTWHLIYDGEFKDGMFSGKGTYYYDDALPCISGTWEKGNISGDYVMYSSYSSSVKDSGYVEGDVIHSDIYGEKPCKYSMPEVWPDSANQ